MKIKRAMKAYEAWLAEQTTLVEADLDLKHAKMVGGLF